MRTATETAREEYDRARDERSLHTMMQRFTEKWTAELRSGDAGEFHADLLMLIQAVHRDASRETHALLTKALAAMPPQPIFNERNP
jgi:hypothetical protein